MCECRLGTGSTVEACGCWNCQLWKLSSWWDRKTQEI